MFLSRQKFCCDKRTFVVTKDVFCRDKHVFVSTKVSLPQQKFCRDKITFVARKDMSLQKTCRDKHVFVATKMILMAAPANDTVRPRSRGPTHLAVVTCRQPEPPITARCFFVLGFLATVTLHCGLSSSSTVAYRSFYFIFKSIHFYSRGLPSLVTYMICRPSVTWPVIHMACHHLVTWPAVLWSRGLPSFGHVKKPLSSDHCCWSLFFIFRVALT